MPCKSWALEKPCLLPVKEASTPGLRAGIFFCHVSYCPTDKDCYHASGPREIFKRASSIFPEHSMKGESGAERQCIGLLVIKTVWSATIWMLKYALTLMMKTHESDTRLKKLTNGKEYGKENLRNRHVYIHTCTYICVYINI